MTQRSEVGESSKSGWRSPSPGFFVSVACKGFAGGICGSVDSRRFAGERFRVKRGKTRCWSVSVASKGDACGEDETRNWKYEMRNCGVGSRVTRTKQILRFAQDDNFLGGPEVPHPPPPPKCRKVRKRLKTKGRENRKSGFWWQRERRTKQKGSVGTGKARKEWTTHGEY
jgi:hypothetical protein